MARGAFRATCLLLTLLLCPSLYLQATPVNLQSGAQSTSTAKPANQSPEQAFAARLLSAKSDEERNSLLTSEAALINGALQKELLDQASTLRARGNYPLALVALGLSERIAEQRNDKKSLAETWNEMGNVRHSQSNFDEALKLYQKAMNQCEALSEKRCLSGAYNGIGLVHRSRGEFELAIQFALKSIAIDEALGGNPGLSASMSNLGSAYTSQGDYVRALEAFRKVLSAAEARGSKDRIAGALNSIGSVYVRQGDHILAMDYFQKSLALSEEIGDKPRIALRYANIGTAYAQRGDYPASLEYYRKAFSAFEALGNRSGAALALNNIGAAYRVQGNEGLALEYLRRALAISEALNDKYGVARTLNNIGLAYSDSGEYEKALENYEKSLKQLEELGAKSGIASVHHSIGMTSALQKNYARSVEHLDKSLRMRAELGETARTGVLLANTGMVYNLKKDYARAIDFAARAVSLAREYQDTDALWFSLSVLGDARLGLGNLEEARKAFEESIAAIETIREQLTGAEQEEQQFFESVVYPYYRMVDLLAPQGKATEALGFAERAKGRVLLDVLAGERSRLSSSMTEQELEEDRALRNSLSLLNTQISQERNNSKPDQKKLQDLKTRLDRVRFDHQDFLSRLFAAHPELRARSGETAQFKIQDASLLVRGTSTAVLEYAVTEEKTYLFAVSSGVRGPDVRVFTIPIGQKGLADLVRTFRDKLAARNLDVKEPARRVYDVLLKPAAALLRGKAHIVIIPDNSLWELPFHAAVAPTGRYLIEDSSISYGPSISVLREMIAKRSTRPRNDRTQTLFALGNPAPGSQALERVKFVKRDETLMPLPEAEWEVKALGQLYGSERSKIYIGREAREDLAKAEGGKFPVLHFATHGILNNVSPMYSHLLLTPGEKTEDGLLEAWELMRMNLKADLVVLSGCETARGRVGAGEGMIGLSWALFVAGAPSVVVSQWKVDSASTAQLMLEFHRSYRLTGSKAKGLRQAMLKLQAQSQYRHPFYWAPFVLIGDSNQQ